MAMREDEFLTHVPTVCQQTKVSKQEKKNRKRKKIHKTKEKKRKAKKEWVRRNGQINNRKMIKQNESS